MTSWDEVWGIKWNSKELNCHKDNSEDADKKRLLRDVHEMFFYIVVVSL